MLEEELTQAIIAAAAEVHKQLGPGLLESAYERCLAHELTLRGLRVQRQLELPIVYKGEHLDVGYRLDLVVEDRVVVEVMAVEELHPIHEARLISYLKLSGMHAGLIINFHVKQLSDGIVKRAV
jgi:GxxExxY protein